MKLLIPKANAGLQTILTDKFTHHQFGIDSTKLPLYGEYHRDKRKTGYLSELFTKLDEITEPVIYRFDAAEGTEAKRLFKIIKSFGNKQKRASKKIRRVVPEFYLTALELMFAIEYEPLLGRH